MSSRARAALQCSCTRRKNRTDGDAARRRMGEMGEMGGDDGAAAVPDKHLDRGASPLAFNGVRLRLWQRPRAATAQPALRARLAPLFLLLAVELVDEDEPVGRRAARGRDESRAVGDRMVYRRLLQHW